jgi:hypothetical protein
MQSYQKICEEILSSLQDRTKDVLSRRFGILQEKKETLELIGKSYQITRERIRQIEKEGVKQAKKLFSKYKETADFFNKELEKFGKIKKEDVFVDILSKNTNDKNYVVFLLIVSDNFYYFPGNLEMHAFWAKDKNLLKTVKEIISETRELLKKEKKLLTFEELNKNKKITEELLASSLEVSKKIIKNGEGFFGLSEWPEINPKGIKDKAYLILKKCGKPLHFREVAASIGRALNPQTTHNELIKDSRFVLVGRGVYALSEWGYVPGEVKEVIRGILEKEGALQKNEIIIKVEEQRIVKKNTIIQNLSNKKYFIKTPDGKYTIA